MKIEFSYKDNDVIKTEIYKITENSTTEYYIKDNDEIYITVFIKPTYLREGCFEYYINLKGTYEIDGIQEIIIDEKPILYDHLNETKLKLSIK